MWSEFLGSTVFPPSYKATCSAMNKCPDMRGGLRWECPYKKGITVLTIIQK